MCGEITVANSDCTTLRFSFAFLGDFECYRDITTIHPALSKSHPDIVSALRSVRLHVVRCKPLHLDTCSIPLHTGGPSTVSVRSGHSCEVSHEIAHQTFVHFDSCHIVLPNPTGICSDLCHPS